MIELGKLLGEYDKNGALLQETVWLEDQPAAVLTPSGTYYVHADHLNAPRVLLDSANRIVWKWDGDAFGVGTANTDPDKDGKSVSYNLRLPGQYYDSESGLHYNTFRDYDPRSGRYVQVDPLGVGAGANPFVYGDLNPLSFTDPLGLDAEEMVLSLPAAMAAALFDTPLPGPGDLAALAILGTALALPGDTATYLDYPPRPRTRGAVRCNCKCYANTQAGGPSGTSAEGAGEGSSIADAQREAEKRAKKALGCQAEHCQCKCINSKGEKSATGGR